MDDPGRSTPSRIIQQPFPVSGRQSRLRPRPITALSRPRVRPAPGPVSTFSGQPARPGLSSMSTSARTSASPTGCSVRSTGAGSPERDNRPDDRARRSHLTREHDADLPRHGGRPVHARSLPYFLTPTSCTQRRSSPRPRAQINQAYRYISMTTHDWSAAHSGSREAVATSDHHDA